jgi:hypothetical protein
VILAITCGRCEASVSIIVYIKLEIMDYLSVEDKHGNREEKYV